MSGLHAVVIASDTLATVPRAGPLAGAPAAPPWQPSHRSTGAAKPASECISNLQSGPVRAEITRLHGGRRPFPA